jgi:hypothetical protein
MWKRCGIGVNNLVTLEFGYVKLILYISKIFIGYL